MTFSWLRVKFLALERVKLTCLDKIPLTWHYTSVRSGEEIVFPTIVLFVLGANKSGSSRRTDSPTPITDANNTQTTPKDKKQRNKSKTSSKKPHHEHLAAAHWYSGKLNPVVVCAYNSDSFMCMVYFKILVHLGKNYSNEKK